MRGKIEIGRPDPSFTLPRPAVLLVKIGLRSEVSDFPHTSVKHGPHRQSDLNLMNNEPSLKHELVCEIVATSGNTKRSAIVIEEGEHLSYL